MRLLVWLLRAAIFFALFAFALNNQHEAGVRWFFGYEWRAPMVFVVLAAFALGSAFGVLAMVPSWWRHRRVVRRQEREAAAAQAEPAPAPAPAPAPSSPPSSRPPAPRRPRRSPTCRCAMAFDLLQWLLIGLPLAFALGWMASRIDLRQWTREQREKPRTYFQGLNLLLNEQQDKAIDAFVEAVQQDPDTADLHFALGNLFRRRGDYERAVRVHEHLLKRADLPAAERERAQHALAQDFMKAGLFDRAEAAWLALEGTSFDIEAQLALLALAERSRDWRAAIDVARRLEQRGTGSFASRISHYWCEIAEEADARQQPDAAAEALAKARAAAPAAARPLLAAGHRLARRGEHAEALREWGELSAAHPAVFALVAGDYAASAVASGTTAAALDWLLALHRRVPSLELLDAIAVLDADGARQRGRLCAFLAQQPQLSAASRLLQLVDAGAGPLSADETRAVADTVGRAAYPLQRYRCAACGFEARHYFWQCPGCMTWDSYPPARLEAV